MSKNNKDETFFGFKQVSKDQKVSLVKQVFSSVASKYDLMNNVMSLGVHHLWKQRMIEMLSNTKGSLLDVAGGTGDIAKLYLKKSAAYAPTIVICDLNYAMLSEGRDKAINENIIKGIEWSCGNAESLPFPDNSFDYYTISFGIRNVADIPKALREAYRVLKPGGKFVCLEFSHPTNPHISNLYDLYSFKVIPFVGKVITGDFDSYQYLVESIRKFPTQREFASLIEQAGFAMVNYENLTFGVTALHFGYKA
jgi:ubiquinone/menaquinone biosynthesis methyltransferase